MSHLSVIRNFWDPFYKHENAVVHGEQENNPLVVCGWDRKYVASYESQTMGEGFLIIQLTVMGDFEYLPFCVVLKFK